jgi:predicted metalloenzyme YecM
MKTKIILPGAAGVIALTALLGFADGQSKSGDKIISNKNIILIGDLAEADHCRDLTLRCHDIDFAGPVYWVKIKCGDSLSNVLINAVTGRVIA